MSLCPDCTADACVRGLTGPARRLCQTDPRYHALITAGTAAPPDNPVPARHSSPAVPRVNRDITHCRHRGEYVETVACATCDGRINLPAFECLINGEDEPRLCTLERPAVDPAIQWCRTCIPGPQ